LPDRRRRYNPLQENRNTMYGVKTDKIGFNISTVCGTDRKKVLAKSGTGPILHLLVSEVFAERFYKAKIETVGQHCEIAATVLVLCRNCGKIQSDTEQTHNCRAHRLQGTDVNNSLRVLESSAAKVPKQDRQGKSGETPRCNILRHESET